MNCKKELLPFDHISYNSCDSAAILSIFHVRCNNVFQDGFVKTKLTNFYATAVNMHLHNFMLTNICLSYPLAS